MHPTTYMHISMYNDSDHAATDIRVFLSGIQSLMHSTCGACLWKSQSCGKTNDKISCPWQWNLSHTYAHGQQQFDHV